jgi:tRNA-dihydrouridine synthase
MLNETKCDAVMIGRAAIGNPWIFKQCNDYIKSHKPTKPITSQERIDMIKLHLSILAKQCDKTYAIITIRSHISKYLRPIKNTSPIIDAFYRSTNYDELIKLLDSLLLNNNI